MAATFVPATRGGLLLRVVVVGIALVIGIALVVAIAVRVPQRSPGEGWVRGAAVSVVRHRGVVFVEGPGAFLVSTGPSHVVAFSDRTPHLGERLRYCPTSGWFEDPAHGAKFDGLGRYALGPALRGMDRFAVEVVDGVVWIDPTDVTPGLPKGTPTTPPAGPFCVFPG